MKYLFALPLMFLSVAPAAAWSDAEIAEAVHSIDRSGVEECASANGGKMRQDTEVRDLNGDGVDEIIITTSADGASACIGKVGHYIDLLISDGKGSWTQNFGDDIHSLEYHKNNASSWPDIELTGPGFCFPIWRMHNGSYGIWKTCDDGNLVFADRLYPDAVPSGAVVKGKARDGASSIGTQAPVEIINISSLHDAMPYTHNGSLMAVDPVRGIIAYDRPKSSISKSVKRGTVLFKGKPWSMDNTDNVLLDGVAFTFKRGCDAAQYDVRGRYHLEYRAFEFTLEGASPQRSKSSCDIIGHTINSPNAKLKFDAAWD